MKIISAFYIIFFTILFSLNLYGAASDQVIAEPDDFETTQIEDEIYDPLEPINRAIFSFNNVADKIILEPVAKGYEKLPSPIQSGISTFLSNLRAPIVVINKLLQGKGENAFEYTGRILINSNLVVFGLFDLAENIGLEE